MTDTPNTSDHRPDEGNPVRALPSARAGRASPEPASSLGHSATIANAVERLAINLRAYGHSRGAPRRDDDEQVALKAAREILTSLEKTYD